MIEEREAAVKAWLKEIVEVKGAKLPILPEQVFTALKGIDSMAAIDEFSPEIDSLQEFINTHQVVAIVFEWSYGNLEVYEGYGFGSCIFEGNPSNTDLLRIEGNTGFEMDTELDDEVEETFYGFSLQTVMAVLYKKIDVEFRHKFDEYYQLNTDAGITIDLDEVMSAYHELFHLKLVELLNKAYSQALKDNPLTITTGKPVHIFIKRHERWPLHIITINN